jgi:hypothetical protein
MVLNHDQLVSETSYLWSMAPDSFRFRERLTQSLKAAMRTRDPVAVAAIRSAMSAIDNAEAVDGPHAPGIRLGVGAGEVARRELPAQEVLDVVRAEISERTAAADEYERMGRSDQVSRLKAEAAVLESLLESAVEATG